MTGYFPHDLSVAPGADYDIEVDRLFGERKFPEVGHIKNGQIILGCWEGKFKAATDVLNLLERESRVVQETIGSKK